MNKRYRVAYISRVMALNDSQGQIPSPLVTYNACANALHRLGVCVQNIHSLSYLWAGRLLSGADPEWGVNLVATDHRPCTRSIKVRPCNSPLSPPPPAFQHPDSAPHHACIAYVGLLTRGSFKPRILFK